MKTALLHHWMVNFRGGEKVLAEFCTLFPDGDIFTHAYNPAKFHGAFDGHKVTETLIGSLPLARKHCQKYLPLMPFALSRLKLDDYDFLLSIESGPIKGVKKRPDAVHVCYCNTPMRYIWDMYDLYYKNTGFAGKIAMRMFRDYMRSYDLKSADCVDHFISNSNCIKERVKRIYGRDSTVIFPPVDVEFFRQKEPVQKKDYYFFISELIPYKRPDLTIQACIRAGKKLIVAGDGPMRRQLEDMAAGHDVTFVRRPNDETLRKLYAEARGLIFPALEDFGIVPLEAQAAGTPVIALAFGGSLDTVRNRETGLLIPELNEQTLCEAIEEFESMKFDPAKLEAHALKFSREAFRKNMTDYLRQYHIRTALP